MKSNIAKVPLSIFLENSIQLFTTAILKLKAHYTFPGIKINIK